MADIGRALGSASIGFAIQTVRPGFWSSRRHRHLFQVVMAGNGVLHHGDERLLIGPGDCVCYLAGDLEAHAFENTGSEDLVIWAFGNRFRHEVCVYPDQGVAFVEGLGADVPLHSVIPGEWTEEGRKDSQLMARVQVSAASCSALIGASLPPPSSKTLPISSRSGSLISTADASRNPATEILSSPAVGLKRVTTSNTVKRPKR